MDRLQEVFEMGEKAHRHLLYGRLDARLICRYRLTRLQSPFRYLEVELPRELPDFNRDLEIEGGQGL